MDVVVEANKLANRLLELLLLLGLLLLLQLPLMPVVTGASSLYWDGFSD